MKNNSPIVLFTPYFKAKTPERQQELDECLQHNVACKHLSKIILLIDDGHVPPVKDKKIEILNIAQRPTYLQWLKLSAQLHKSSISILANTDIHFDDTLTEIHKALDTPETFMALSRYERLGNSVTPHPNPHWSQDTWAIRTPFTLSPSIEKGVNISLGVPRCDNKLAYIFAINGWKIVNPINQLRSIHLHETQQRSYDKQGDTTILGGAAYIHASKTVNEPAKIEIDIWVRNAQAISDVRLNKLLDKWAKKTTLTPYASLGQPTVDIVKPSPAKSQVNIPKKSLPLGLIANEELSPEVIRTYLHKGTLLYNHLRRFRIYQRDNQMLCFDGLNPKKSYLRPAPNESVQPLEQLDIGMLAAWIPPVFDISPIVIRDRPNNGEDHHFWQYPCATEKQAYENHLSLKLGENIDYDAKLIHVYLPLAWATYIDKKHYPSEIVGLLKPRLMGLKSLAKANGYKLSVHTVCQQIHWRRFIKYFHELGVTDLHISHAEQGIKEELEEHPLRIHSWPLIAVNIENDDRKQGLVFNKPVSKKRYLASFIGAHMPHYRSDVRLKLLDSAKRDGGDDLVIDLGQEWHFNKIVYHEQVANKSLSVSDIDKHNDGTQRYNEVISDSVFSLCPEGAGPNTLRVWESMAVGSIPVIIADKWIPPQLDKVDFTIRDCCVFIAANKINELFTLLRGLDAEKVNWMQSACIKAYSEIRKKQAFRLS